MKTRGFFSVSEVLTYAIYKIQPKFAIKLLIECIFGNVCDKTRTKLEYALLPHPRRGKNSVASAKPTAPTTIALSAILNAG